MPRVVACAVVRDDPPEVFLAADQDTLNWVLALREERWGEAVALRMRDRPEVDVYPSFELYIASDVELAAQELEFTPLFKD
jgi:hypothetical protein